jgi:hypothetical protein
MSYTKFRAPTVFIATALGFAVVYHLAWLIQQNLLGWFDLYEGVSALFLPAGIKMLAIMIGGLPGILGVILVSISTDMDVWGNQGIIFHLTAKIIWGGAPYLAYQLLKANLDIDNHLKGLTLGKIVLIGLVTSAFSTIASRAFYYAAGRLSIDIFNVSAWAMLVGDIAGICVVLYAAKNLGPILTGSKLTE